MRDEIGHMLTGLRIRNCSLSGQVELFEHVFATDMTAIRGRAMIPRSMQRPGRGPVWNKPRGKGEVV